MIRIRVNGDERELREGCRLSELVDELGLKPELVAIELNKKLVPRAQRDETVLAEGDRVELVTLVGGG